MIIQMSRPWEHPKTGVWYFRSRIPAHLAHSALGQTATIDVATEASTVKLGSIIKVSLRTKDEGEARLDVAIHELESRSIILWGAALDRFLRAYLLQHPTGDLPLDDTELSERFEVAFDEATQPLTRYLLKTALCGGPALSLSQLAARRYKPNTSSFRKLQRHLLRATVYPMRDLCLWSVEVQERALNNGKTAIASYRISAGPALLAFHRHVYLPWRTRQLRAFCSQHLGKE